MHDELQGRLHWAIGGGRGLDWGVFGPFRAFRALIRPAVLHLMALRFPSLSTLPPIIFWSVRGVSRLSSLVSRFSCPSFSLPP